MFTFSGPWMMGTFSDTNPKIIINWQKVSNSQRQGKISIHFYFLTYLESFRISNLLIIKMFLGKGPFSFRLTIIIQFLKINVVAKVVDIWIIIFINFCYQWIMFILLCNCLILTCICLLTLHIKKIYLEYI